MIGMDWKTEEAGETCNNSVPSISHLQQALIELLEGDGNDRERLTIAAASFRLALTSYLKWPSELQTDADLLRMKLTRAGHFEATIARMNEAALREVSDELWRFCQNGLLEFGEEWLDGRADSLDGIELLQEAKALLAGNGCDRENLRSAARRFWSAEFFCDTWPHELRSMTQEITAQIFRHGPIDEAIYKMSEAELNGLKLDLLRFCQTAEQFEGYQADSSDSVS